MVYMLVLRYTLVSIRKWYGFMIVKVLRYDVKVLRCDLKVLRYRCKGIGFTMWALRSIWKYFVTMYWVFQCWCIALRCEGVTLRCEIVASRCEIVALRCEGIALRCEGIVEIGLKPFCCFTKWLSAYVWCYGIKCCGLMCVFILSLYNVVRRAMFISTLQVSYTVYVLAAPIRL